MTCKNCGYENKLGVRYCQRCGQYIEPKRTLAQEAKSLDFRSLAGVGRRDVNIAPLFTASPVQTPGQSYGKAWSSVEGVAFPADKVYCFLRDLPGIHAVFPPHPDNKVRHRY